MSMTPEICYQSFALEEFCSALFLICYYDVVYDGLEPNPLGLSTIADGSTFHITKLSGEQEEESWFYIVDLDLDDFLVAPDDCPFNQCDLLPGDDKLTLIKEDWRPVGLKIDTTEIG